MQEGIPVHHAIPQKFRGFESRNHGKYAFLFSPFEPCLKTDKVKHGPFPVFCPQLNSGKRPPSTSWIDQTNRFHGTEGHNHAPPCRHNLYGHAALKNLCSIKSVNRCRFGIQQCLIESVILSLIHGRIQIVISKAVPALREDLFHVQ